MGDDMRKLVIFIFLTSLAIPKWSDAGNHSSHVSRGSQSFTLDQSRETKWGLNLPLPDEEIWNADPRELRRETLFFLIMQLADALSDLKADRELVFFNPLNANQLLIKPSQIMGRSLKIKTRNTRGFRVQYGNYPNDFYFFSTRLKIFSRMLTFLDEFIQRRGSLLVYLSEASHPSYSGSSLASLNPSQLPSACVLVLDLYLKKIRFFPDSPDFPDLVELQREGPLKRNKFNQALTAKTRDFFDPNFKYLETQQVSRIFRFYESLVTIVKQEDNLTRLTLTGPSGPIHVSISDEIDGKTKSLLFEEMLKRIQTELQLRKFLSPERERLD